MAIYVGRHEPVGGGVVRTGASVGSTPGGPFGFGGSVDGGGVGGGKVFTVDGTGSEFGAAPGAGGVADGTGRAVASGSLVEGTEEDGMVELARREDDAGPVRGGPTRVVGGGATVAS